jgi:hypothetical protein
MDELTWMCEHCHDERPDRFITVTKVETRLFRGGTIGRNFRHCADREKCVQGAVIACDEWQKYVATVQGPSFSGGSVPSSS